MQFTLLGLAVTVLIAAGFGWLLSRRMIEQALNDAAQEAAQAVTALITPHVRPDDFATPTPSRVAAWKQRVSQVVGGMDIVRVKVWNARGQVVYSDEQDLIGQSYPLEQHEELREALKGHLAKELSKLEKSENVAERTYGRLLEIYVPVAFPGDAQVVGAYEVYRSYAPQEAKIEAITRFIWGGSAAAFGLLYLSLFLFVSGASRQLSRLASFPLLSPYPVIEMNLAGKVTYRNPAAARLFPDLPTNGLEHPVLAGLKPMPAQLQTEGSLVREVDVGTAHYRQVVHHVPQSALLRIYCFDDTDRKRAEEEIVQQLETLTALYASATKLSRSLDLQQLGGDVTRSCVEVFGTRLAWLGRAEPDGRVQPLAYFPQQVQYGRYAPPRWDDSPEGQGISGRAIRTGFPVVMGDLTTDPIFARSKWREAALAEGFRTGAAFPLISRDRPFGVLNLYSDQPGFFTPKRVEFFGAYAHLAAAALENARLFEEARSRLEQVQALRNIDMAIAATLDLRVTLNVILDQVATQLRVDATDVLLLNPRTQVLEYAAGRGFRTTALQHTRLRLGESHAGIAALERRIVSFPNLPEAQGDLRHASLLADEGFSAYYAVPLSAKGQVKGVLEIFHRIPLAPNPEWLDFLEVLGAQTALAIDNAVLFDDLQRANVSLTAAYDATIEGWSRALDLRDKETEGHTIRVTEMTVRLARAMALSEEEIVHLRRGALLHDIGKMGIPDSILLKPGQLTDEEWVIMRRHPVYAYELLFPIAYLRPALDIPHCHHEKWDGTGYPRGLRMEQIPISARIFAVVDVWDALRSDRPYRAAWPEERVRLYIREQAHTYFDPKVVEVFLLELAHSDVEPQG